MTELADVEILGAHDALRFCRTRVGFDVYGSDDSVLLHMELAGRRICIRSPWSRVVATVEPVWSLLLARSRVMDETARVLAVIRQHWSWRGNRYSIEDATGAELAEFRCGFINYSEFRIVANGREAGLLVRRYTAGDASTPLPRPHEYSLAFPPDLEASLRLLCVATAIAIQAMGS